MEPILTHFYKTTQKFQLHPQNPGFNIQMEVNIFLNFTEFVMLGVYTSITQPTSSPKINA